MKVGTDWYWTPNNHNVGLGLWVSWVAGIEIMLQLFALQLSLEFRPEEQEDVGVVEDR